MRVARRTMTAALLLTFALAGCQKASEAECEAACLHYSLLGLAEQEELALGSEELEQAWAAMQEREELEQGRYHCVQMCEGSASPGQTACITEAESLAEADDCSGVSRARAPGDDDVDE